jgi:FlaA1/EpsC-like NDP-sugar epimerase
MKTILVTGAAGSLGRELVRVFADEGYTVRAMDINESGLSMLKRDNVRLLYGNIGNKERVDFAMEGVDVVVHTASLKNLEITEYNVDDTIQTNIVGTLNVANAIMDHEVGKAILIGSDKSVDPDSVYGVSKLAQEQIWLWCARVYKGCDFMIGRFGNFIGSSGSCYEVWDRQKAAGKKITVTDISAERYFISIEDVAVCVLRMVKGGENGRIYVPKMEMKNIYQLAIEHTRCDAEDIEVTGLRGNEHVFERLHTQREATRIKDMGDHYVV